MKFDKADLIPIGVIVAGIGILYYLYARQTASADSGLGSGTAPPPSTGIEAQQGNTQQYPNAGITPAGAVTVGGSPLSITYNTPNPPADEIDIGEPDSGCGCGAGNLTQSLTIPQSALTSALSNLTSLFNGTKTAVVSPQS